MVTVTVENLGNAAAEVPITINMQEGEVTKRLQVDRKTTASIRIEAPSAPVEVIVNDGSVPESDMSNNIFKIPPPEAAGGTDVSIAEGAAGAIGATPSGIVPDAPTGGRRTLSPGLAGRRATTVFSAGATAAKLFSPGEGSTSSTTPVFGDATMPGRSVAATRRGEEGE